MKIVTETGSTYEIDVANKRIRRLTGKGNPTPRVGKDGKWREYNSIGPVKEGLRLAIVWSDQLGSLGAVPGALPGTVTSPIVEIDQS